MNSLVKTILSINLLQNNRSLYRRIHGADRQGGACLITEMNKSLGTMPLVPKPTSPKRGNCVARQGVKREKTSIPKNSRSSLQTRRVLSARLRSILISPLKLRKARGHVTMHLNYANLSVIRCDPSYHSFVSRVFISDLLLVLYFLSKLCYSHGCKNKL